MARIPIRSGKLLGYLSRMKQAGRGAVKAVRVSGWGGVRKVQRLIPGGSREALARIGKAHERTEIQRVLAGPSSQRHYSQRGLQLKEMAYELGRTRERVRRRAVVGGVAAGVVGAHAAAYAVSEGRGRRGEGPSRRLKGPFATRGYQKGKTMRQAAARRTRARRKG